MRVKMSKQPPPAPTASAVGPCSTISQIRRTHRHWNFAQHHRPTHQPPGLEMKTLLRLQWTPTRLSLNILHSVNVSFAVSLFNFLAVLVKVTSTYFL